MKNKNLRHALRQNNILKLIIPAVIFIIALLLMIFNPMDNSVRVVTVEDISHIDELYASGSQHIQYTTGTLYYAGVDYNVNNRPRAQVYYSLDNGRCYFYIISTDKIPTGTPSASGVLLNARLIHNNNMYTSIIASLSESIDFALQGLDEICSKTIISQYDFSHGFSIYYTAVILAVCIICGIGVVTRICMIAVLSLSPPVYHLRKYGNRNALFAAAQRELRHSPPPRMSGLYITDNFMIHITPSATDIIPLDNITLIYTSNEIRHFHGSPMLHSMLCVLTDARRSAYRIRHMSERVATEIINELSARYPQIATRNEHIAKK